ncbi:outer membrane receptor protein involved in Fe transport [Novosphingobium sp. PhB165]|uniref:TonB-dependent receptor n=1 Tax=Novosphingobium sp. PhB165 TaxID=2485105 RepID=UPI0010506F4B|nr:TonB-dependent receptor [Novosphingobium sp. PhB165]TCM21680.1 outer membrane receptor protein involved in Fe transport [Novosphingobium sp. PhB165]
MRRAFLLCLTALAVPLPVAAQAPGQLAIVATREGTAGDAAIELARQTGTSIVIADPRLASRRIPALRGRMEAHEAVARLARAAGARAVSAGRGAWRLDLAPEPRRVIAETPPAKPAAVHHAEPTPQPIVVTATKRDLRLDQVPAQVTILGGESLTAGGVGGSEKIVRRLATVASTQLGSGRNKLFIRGIADSSFTGPTQATVGQYIGDMRLTYNAPDPDLRLSDLARVEVLEGPQGTLYGAGSLGGIIRLVPNPPVFDTTGGSIILGGALTQHGAPSTDLSATVNLPVATDTAAFRATFDTASYGGYIDKPLMGRKNVNRTDVLGGRAALRVRVAPDWTVDVMGLAQSIDAADSQYADRGGAPLENSARVREGSNADYALGQLVVAGRIGGLELRSTTGAVRQNLHERYDAGTPDGPPRLFEQNNATRMIAHETRLWQPELHGFGWLLGASYTRNRTTLTREFEEQTFRSSATGVRNTVDEFTLYGEASLHLTGPFTATAGGRFTHARLGGDGEDLSPLVALAMAARNTTAQRTFTAFLPALALHAAFSGEDQFYIRYQEGFRPGGFAIESDYVRRFRNDRTGTVEMGARHGRAGVSPFDLAVSLSYTRWRDIQADFTDSAGLPSTANIGDGRVWSASVSAGVKLMQGLRLEAGAAFNRSRIDKPEPGAEMKYFYAAATVQALQMQVPNIARFAGRAALAWNHDLDGDLAISGNAWASYLGKSRLGIGPDLGMLQGDYFDSGFDLRLGTPGYGVTLSVTNLADERGNRFALGTPLATGREQVTPLRPRTVRLGFDAKF